MRALCDPKSEETRKRVTAESCCASVGPAVAVTRGPTLGPRDTVSVS